jgi:hypothetical protein
LSGCAVSPELPVFDKKGAMIYQTTSTGRIEYHKPAYTILPNGAIYQVTPSGRIEYHKPALKGVSR